ncbi:MAG: hypothetical protein EXS25_06465 [Pedosphaera sp.]|nr:hypothetical protein [Pedosphaera sp.]
MQFRGPQGSGTSPDATPPTEWSASRNLLWTTPLPGAGSSSPIISGDRIFLTTWTETRGGSSIER